ncbi:hypothetical protein BDB00DRAFT_766439 [Zychaea mexicana]|uniref:uncharacterized protein n=1 Tax=Zychaea mexicana TaxID=64656 RepID=UPI0022FE5B64|nr:uncharacterized protein BDB00DRAFT_766439 [Zychaea mexicana]KAI9491749.1 hypothetical protein BDB00DRAFT_766439 [Zychaea mexicana]
MLWPGLVEPPVDITIPPPIVVRTPVLVVFYWMLMSLDYLVLKYESKIPLSKMQVRIVLAIVHVAIPLVIASSRVAANLFFIALPWFYAAYSSLIPVEKYSYREWSESLQYLLLDAPDDKRLQLATRMIPKLELSKQEQRDARIKGAARIGRGVCKLIVMKLIVDPLLPEQQQLSSMLMLPWLHPTSLLLTLLFGCKAYFFLGVADVGMGLQQVSLGVPTVDLFDRPMIAATPREFWR